MPINMGEFGKLKEYTPRDTKKKPEEEKRKNKKECDRRCNKRYYEENKEERNEYSKGYYEEHKTEIMKKNKEYKREHMDEFKEYHKEYNRTYKDKHLYLGSFGEECFLTSLYQGVNENGKVLGTGSFQRFRTPEENRLESIKSKIKNATTLNEWFPDSEAHHVSEGVVIFIPVELHRSIRHNLKTGENMDLINGKALIWAGKQEGSEVNN